MSSLILVILVGQVSILRMQTGFFLFVEVVYSLLIFYYTSRNHHATAS